MRLEFCNRPPKSLYVYAFGWTLWVMVGWKHWRAKYWRKPGFFYVNAGPIAIDAWRTDAQTT